jgi:hypothetical protein
MDEHEKPQKREFTSHDRWLTFSLILGPMSALAGMSVAYTLVPEACERDSKGLLHASIAGSLVLALVAAAIAWRIYNAFSETGGVDWKERMRWMASLALILALFSTLMILALEIPNWVLRSCD